MDETCIGPLVVRVTHRLERIDALRTRVVYAIEVEGPEAAEAGRAISSDFPQVLGALAAAGFHMDKLVETVKWCNNSMSRRLKARTCSPVS